MAINIHVPLTPLIRRPLVISPIWLELIGTLPLSPSSFLSGSAATWLAMNSFGERPSWEPADFDIFCLGSRIQFIQLVRQYAHDRNCEIHPAIDDDTVSSQFKFNCRIDAKYSPRPNYILYASFIHVKSSPYCSHNTIPTVMSVLNRFDVDVGRVVVFSSSEHEWWCSDVVFRQLQRKHMFFVLSFQNSEELGECPFDQHERLVKYQDRGFKIRFLQVNVRSSSMPSAERRVRFFNNIMMVFQHLMTRSFDLYDSAVTFCSLAPELRVPARQKYPIPFRFSVNRQWIDMIDNLPLNGNVFIAGEAAAWLALASLFRSVTWKPDCVVVICVTDRQSFTQIIQNFISSISCAGLSNTVSDADLSDVNIHQILILSVVGPVIFHFTPLRPDGSHPGDSMMQSYDVTLCRVTVHEKNFICCSPSIRHQMENAIFFVDITAARDPNSGTINRVHKWMSRGYALNGLTMNLGGICEVPPHERILMFHNAILMCMSLTFGRTLQNQSPQIVGCCGVDTLYPQILDDSI